MARKKRNDEELKSDGWLGTYADTITLLLTFFVLLYSMSTIDNVKLQALSEAFKISFMSKDSDSIIEMTNGTNPITNGSGDTENTQDKEGLDEDYDEYMKALEELYKEVSNYIGESGIAAQVHTVKTEKGVMLQLNDNVLFDTAKADLNNDSYYVLDKISTLIESLPNEILVEGHTDNRPINTDEYPSNWELSTTRAVNVLKYFVERKGLSPDRFSAAGYGEYKPLVDNDSSENMAYNRRVSILILNVER